MTPSWREPVTAIPCARLPLASRAVEQFHDDCSQYGVVRVADAIPPFVLNQLREAVTKLVAAPPLEGNVTWQSPAESGRMVVQRITRANMFSPVIHALVAQSCLLRTLGAFALGVPTSSTRIANGSEGSDGIVLVIKDPDNVTVHRQLRWHRDDTFTRHLPINPFVNCGIYLDSADERRGGLLVIPGSHKRAGTAPFEETTRRVSGQVCVAAQPGDVIIHRAELWHRSGSHLIAGEIRRVLYANVYRP